MPLTHFKNHVTIFIDVTEKKKERKKRKENTDLNQLRIILKENKKKKNRL